MRTTAVDVGGGDDALFLFANSALLFVNVVWHLADGSGSVVRGVFPEFGHCGSLVGVSGVPRVFDVVAYDESLYFVFGLAWRTRRKV